MITQPFDISKKPLSLYDKNAYWVDCKNVKLHRKLVQKYYDSEELQWFDYRIQEPIYRNEGPFILYYREHIITRDPYPESSRAYKQNFTIYYITNQLITVE
jgi:hypothetical protein